jgi:hypothetical protein
MRDARSNHLVSKTLAGWLALASVFGAPALIEACASSSSTTTGKRIALQTRVTAGPEATTAFTNAMGWSITLDELVISTGAFYYFDGATIFSQLTPAPRTPSDRLHETFGVSEAFAHPGHYVPGNARGQMLVPSSVDLHAGGAVLATGDGVTGVVRSATFSFNAPPTGPLAGELGAHVVVVEGTATKGAETRIFRAEIDAADVANTKSAPAVEGCPFTETTMDADGTVTLGIKLPLWFDQVEFDSLPASTDGKPVLMTSAEIARNELVRGMKAGDGYVFSYAH